MKMLKLFQAKKTHRYVKKKQGKAKLMLISTMQTYLLLNGYP